MKTSLGPTLSRRVVLCGGLGAAACAATNSALAGAGQAGVTSPTAAETEDWASFKRRFIAEGRVIDTGNQNVSHSEGQGWGLFFAETYNDPEVFDRIYRWTSRALRRPGDALHAWKYTPGAANPVADLNNATDGDLFIAAALARAARRWGQAEYGRASAVIARDVLRLLVRQVGSHTLLLPGVQGFTKAGAVVVNPSYYVFPLFADLARQEPSPMWGRLQEDGLALIAQGRFGRWGLPPDWLQIAGGALQPAPGWPPRFSYDAVRVPLYLAWSGLSSPEVRADFLRFWAGFSDTGLPAWIDLETDAVAPYPAPPGMLAIRRLGRDAWDGGPPEASFPDVAAAPDYYSAALILLARIASREREMREKP